jgi:hypothetical protein
LTSAHIGEEDVSSKGREMPGLRGVVPHQTRPCVAHERREREREQAQLGAIRLCVVLRHGADGRQVVEDVAKAAKKVRLTSTSPVKTM